MRVRLTKQRLAELGMDRASSDEDGDEEEEEDKMAGGQRYLDPLTRRLQKDVLKTKGKYFKVVADKFAQSVVGSPSSEWRDAQPVPRKSDRGTAQCLRVLTGHRYSVTCVAVTDDESRVYSGSKDQMLLG